MTMRQFRSAMRGMGPVSRLFFVLTVMTVVLCICVACEIDHTQMSLDVTKEPNTLVVRAKGGTNRLLEPSYVALVRSKKWPTFGTDEPISLQEVVQQLKSKNLRVVAQSLPVGMESESTVFRLAVRNQDLADFGDLYLMVFDTSVVEKHEYHKFAAVYPLRNNPELVKTSASN